MKIVFFVYHAGFVRNFEPVLRALAEQGCTIHLCVDVVRNEWELTLANQLVAAYPGISMGRPPVRRVPTTWMRLAATVRHALDYLRYLHPDYSAADGLRLRAEERTPRSVAWLGSRLGRMGFAWVRRGMAALRAIERAIPTVPEVNRFLQREAPDLVVVTPLVDFGSQQVDYIKSAQRLGLRTAVWVASWDNLTNKGLLRVRPDRLFVWNEVQKREAVEFHDIPPDRVVITGAQTFDQWFGRRPRRSREEFCAHVGLEPARDIILYLGSSRQIAPDEVGFAASWLRLLRASDSSALARASILFRPHPGRVPEWLPLASIGSPHVAVWPRDARANAFDPDFNDDYFESMYYARLVVGVNTSGMIESAILGKPVHTWRTPEFADAQAGTRHFQYLVSVNGGLLHVATSASEHLQMLNEALSSPPEPDGRARRFVEAFVRPYGLEEPATPRFVAAVQQLLREPAPAIAAPGLVSRASRPLLRLAAPLVIAATSDRSLGETILRAAIAVVVSVAVVAYRAAALFSADGPVRRAGPRLSRTTRVGYKRLQRGARNVQAAGRTLARDARKRREQWRRDAYHWRRRAARGTRETAKGARKALRRTGRDGRKIVRRVSRRCMHGAVGLVRRFTGL